MLQKTAASAVHRRASVLAHCFLHTFCSSKILLSTKKKKYILPVCPISHVSMYVHVMMDIMECTIEYNVCGVYKEVCVLT